MDFHMAYVDLSLLTSEKLKEPHPEDLLLAKELEAEGLRVRLENWEGFDPNTAETGAVLFRTTWGYSSQVDKFKKFLKALSQSGLSVWNPLPLVRWNLDKKYLLELAHKGLPIVETEIHSGNKLPYLRQRMEDLEWVAAVLKPSIGASGERCIHLDREEDWARKIESLQAKPDEKFLFQEFETSILDEGEYSLIFIDGEFSHSVRKLPKSGEFRCQAEHGGSIQSGPTPPAALEVASRCLSALSEEPLYARVDLVHQATARYLIMEVELIEPELFMIQEPRAARQLAASLSKQL